LHTSFDVRLRRLCPCAECKGEWGQPGKLDANPELTPQQTELGDMRPVGRYALMPIWADGHNTGIYSWEWLALLGREQEQRWALYLAALEQAGLDR